MSINKYATSGFIPGQGECIIQIISQTWRKNYISNVAIEFTDVSHPSDQTEALKKSEAKGHLYLTNKQLVWVNKLNNKLKSFSCSFSSIKDFKLKQPMFGANLIKGSTVGEPGDFGFKGTVDWKLTFNDGGAVDYGKCLIQTQKNPPNPHAFQHGNGVFYGVNGNVVQVNNGGSWNNTPMTQMANGQFYLPPAGSMAQNNPQRDPNAPPTYDISSNDPGVVPPPQYIPSSSSNQQQNYPGQGGDKSREAGF